MGTMAIIGGGFSGVVTAKIAKECGIEPVIFEKRFSVGGVWEPAEGLAWDSMRTNISHYTCMFSDFAWKPHVDDFPTEREVFAYLKDYMKEFDLHKYVRLNANVEKVFKINDRWKVQWQEGERLFDFVVIASGFFAEPVIPQFPGMENFKGRITLAKGYKNPENFQGKEVVILGNAFSGCEIAAEVSTVAKRTLHIASKSKWVLPKYLKAKDSECELPGDLVYYSRAAHLRNLGVPAEQLNQRKNGWFADICKEQQQIPELKVTSDSKEPPYIAISDGYVENVKNKRVEFIPGGIEIFKTDGVVLRDGSHIQADEVILCTGYKPDLPFLDQAVLNSIDYLPDDKFLPLLLHKTVFPKDHSGLAFVGMYRGPFLGVMELQARYACMAFSRKIPLPTAEEIQAGIAEEQKIRDLFPKPQFPHGDYVGLCEDIARQIKVAPDLEALKQSDPPLHKQLLEGPFTVASYRLTGFGSKPELALRLIKQINGASSS
jgi:dimethylaniline monooxygenase (N-oxide forming)